MYPNHIDMDNVHMPTLEEIINYVKSNVGSRVRLQIEIKPTLMTRMQVGLLKKWLKL